MSLKRKRLLAWWYLAIAAGFVLLAVNYTLLHDKPWLIAIRLVFAAGFGILSRLEFTKR